MKNIPKNIPPQKQDTQPGKEHEMQPEPVYDNGKPGSGKLKNKVAIITGGDSGIGRAVAVNFAKEGANLVVVYLNEHEDARDTEAAIKRYNSEVLLIATDISREDNCKDVIEQSLARFGRIDILINNAGMHYPQERIEDISAEQLRKTFEVNVFSLFYLCRYAVPHMSQGSSIINTASITAYRGNEDLIDYSASKGAVVAFTRSLAKSLSEKGIRVNGVAPGPVWTPLIPASFSPEKVAKFGKDTEIGRVAQPFEIAPSFIFLASEDASYMTGQMLHPNGGSVINT